MAVLRALTLGVADLAAMERFWTDVLQTTVVEREDDLVCLDLGGGLTLDLAPVPQPRGEQLRLHLDLRPPPGVTQADELERLLALGAVRVDVGQPADASWVVLADPEGHEFCLLRGPG
jgi:catechol 2,3-dioxygenase-like lactoylglutathione lyase family enzyme